MNKPQTIIRFLIATCAIIDASASNFSETTTEGSDVTPQLSWEMGAALPNKHADAHYYAAILLRTRNWFFGWPSYRVYELGAIARTDCYRCESGVRKRASSLETPIVGISEQFEILSTKHFSFEAGLGGYLKKPTDAVGSAFTFGERIALKTSLENFEVEIFYRHFSNGSFTADNSGYDFVGLSFYSQF